MPLVLYQDPGGWTAAREFSDLIDGDAALLSALKAYLPRFQVCLVELGPMSDAALWERSAMGLVLQALRDSRSPESLSHLSRTLQAHQTFLTSRPGLELLSMRVEYWLESTEHAPTHIEAAVVSALGPESREVFMTGAQMLREEGLNEGMQKGMQKGRDEGQRELLSRVLEQRFGALPPTAVERLQSADLDTLERWALRLFDAKRLDDAFGL